MRGLERKFVSSNGTSEFDEVHLNESVFRVAPHWFWPQYVENWEPLTWAFFEQFVDVERPVVDIGSWIGPTILFASALGAKRIIAVEGNPKTAEHLGRTQGANPPLAGLEIINRVISSSAGSVSFGNLDGSEATSSASSTRGHGFNVPTSTISDIIEKFECEDACIVKMDIEGSELLVTEQIAALSKLKAAVLLSLHPPFWNDLTTPAFPRDLLDALKLFRIWSVEGKELSIQDVAEMSKYLGETPPSWGTAFGNFFELVLQPYNAEKMRAA